MSEPAKQRTISYLRAVWDESVVEPPELEAVVADCLETMPDPPATRTELRGGHAEVRHRRNNGPGLCLHVAAWTEGEPASVVPHGGNTWDLNTRPPDPGEDYLDGAGMFLILGDHCFVLPSGLRQPTMVSFLHYLLAKGDSEFDGRHFRLVPAGDLESIGTLYAEGMKSIDFNVGLYRETFRQKLGVDIVSALLDEDLTDEERERAANLSAHLVFKVDQRSRWGLKPRELAPAMRTIGEELPHESFDLVTGEGTRIRAGQLVLTKPVKLRPSGKTVDHEDAWREMESYMDALRENGRLVQ